MTCDVVRQEQLRVRERLEMTDKTVLDGFGPVFLDLELIKVLGLKCPQESMGSL